MWSQAFENGECSSSWGQNKDPMLTVTSFIAHGPAAEENCLAVHKVKFALGSC